ncbi:MAG: hypothetical protein AAGU27_22840, partial [Dehalobacterium sp.]
TSLNAIPHPLKKFCVCNYKFFQRSISLLAVGKVVLITITTFSDKKLVLSLEFIGFIRQRLA